MIKMPLRTRCRLDAVLGGPMDCGTGFESFQVRPAFSSKTSKYCRAATSKLQRREFPRRAADIAGHEKYFF
jgi:hypothetical protein